MIIERVIATFPRDEVVDLSRILQLLDSEVLLDLEDEVPTKSRLPALRKGIKGCLYRLPRPNEPRQPRTIARRGCLDAGDGFQVRR